MLEINANKFAIKFLENLFKKDLERPKSVLI